MAGLCCQGRPPEVQSLLRPGEDAAWGKGQGTDVSCDAPAHPDRGLCWAGLGLVGVWWDMPAQHARAACTPTRQGTAPCRQCCGQSGRELRRGTIATASLTLMGADQPSTAGWTKLLHSHRPQLCSNEDCYTNLTIGMKYHRSWPDGQDGRGKACDAGSAGAPTKKHVQ